MMNCPVCDGVKMREVEKNDILIDVCPSCKGVWLDRGELDKLMQGIKETRQDYNEWYYRENQREQSMPRPDQSYPPNYPPKDAYKDDYKHDYNHPKYKKKKSVMDVFGDLFD